MQFENNGGRCYFATGRTSRQGFTCNKLSDFEEQFVFTFYPFISWKCDSALYF